jgi:hypothetical protein
MSRLEKLQIVTGKVVDVQIIERLMEGANAAVEKGPVTGSIVGRQRIFIDGPGAADPHYDFDRCELAVRKDQEVAFARLPVKGKKGKPVVVMLLNRTMDEAWSFREGIDILAPPPGIGVGVKAFGAALALAALAWAVMTFVAMRDAGQVQTAGLSLAIFTGAWLVLWATFGAMRIGARDRRRKAVAEAVKAKLRAAPAAGQ